MKKFLNSFRYAFKGIAFAFSTQLNFKVHVCATVAAVFFGYLFKISLSEWLWICCAVAGVIVCELFNTALELLVDLVSPDINPKAGAIKDVAAAAVLMAALFALTIALIIFVPKILTYAA